ncbi:MAG: VWA domain-containing protein [bacterium]|nr:VWA domain-containing protein [bacterium]
MDFLFNDYLYLLLAIPILAVLYYLSDKYAEHMKYQIISSALFMKMGIRENHKIRIISFAFLLGALIFFILALARPLGDFISTDQEMSGSEILICFDVSTSMLARDVKPNRLEHGKETLRRVIKELRGDRIGIVIFSENPSIFCPLTNDYSAVLSFIDEIDYDYLNGGTKLADALDMAMKILQRNQEITSQGKGIIIISDGEDQGSPVDSICKKLKDEGIKVVALGLGTEEGGPIPVPKKTLFDMMDKKFIFNDFLKQEEYEYKKYKGKTVITKLDATQMKNVAKLTNGKYIELGSSHKTLEIVKTLNQFKKFKGKTKKFQDREEIFQRFLLPGVILLILHLLIPEEWRRKKSSL